MSKEILFGDLKKKNTEKTFDQKKKYKCPE